MTSEIYSLMSKVMEDVGAVRKADRNDHQNFNFRGIDAVTNAASPAFRKHGVIVFPELQSIEYATIEIGKDRKLQSNVRVQVTYTFVAASDGSKIQATVAAEAMDAGDKATAKAMSVAFRTCLIQALCLPTDEIDPDAETYERSPRQAAPQKQQAKKQPEPAVSEEDAPMTAEQRQQFITQCAKNAIDPQAVAANAGVDLDGDVTQADVAKLRIAYNELKSFKEGA